MNQIYHVKIFGERNTSTIAIKMLIEKNSDSKILPSGPGDIDKNFALKIKILSHLPCSKFLKERYMDSIFHGISPLYSWKHTATYFADVKAFANCFVIFTLRHPASWLLALHRRPYHNLQPMVPNFRDFITSKWKTVERDSLGGISCMPVDLYNYKLASYLDFMAKLDNFGIKYSIVNFEDFASNQLTVFGKLKPYLSNLNNIATTIELSTKDKSKNRAYYKKYYGKQLWLEEINHSDKDYINQKINWEIARKFGYEPLKQL